MALRTQNKNPYLIGGNPTGSAYVPVSYGDFVEIDSSKVAVPSTTTPTFTYSGGMNGNGVVTVNNGNSSQVGSNASITYAEGTNNYGAGTGNYITPSQTVDTTYTQALGAVIPTSTPTNDYTPYNGGGGTIVLDTKTGGTKVVDNGTGGTGLPEGVKPVQVTPTIGAPPEDIDPNKVTLDQHYKNIYEMGLANAEKAKQQAIINAKGQYNEFINPYGVQAEQQARMGLMGGGYSEYLKGKAYEGMIDTQNQARSDYAKTQQSLYSDYMGNMAAYNQAKIDKADAGKAAKAELLNNISGYTSQEALGAALDALGITDATERQSIIDQWKTAKAEKDSQKAGANAIAMGAYLNGESEDGTPKSVEDVISYGKGLQMTEEEINKAVEQWKSMQTIAKNEDALAGMDRWGDAEWDNALKDETYNSYTPEQQEIVNAGFSNRIAQASGYDANTGATTSYFTNANGQLAKDDAEKLLNETMNDPHLSQPLKDAIKKEYENTYLKGQSVENVDYVEKAKKYDLPKWTKVKDNATVVDVKSEAFALNEFGVFNDTVSGKGEQNKYLNAIIDAAKANQIPEGSAVIVNYGRNKGNVDAFIYVGDGKFVKLDTSKVGNTTSSVKFGIWDNVWTPDGYHNYGNTIEKN